MDRRGFTMVELLATVAILGILSGLAITAVSSILNRAHEEYYNNQEKNLVLAAQAYYNANKTKLPKVIGKKSEVTAKELRNANYLKEELTNYDGKACKTKESDKDSYVEVFKYGQQEYSYTAYLNCGKRSAKATKKEKSPGFDVSFPGGEKKEDKIVYEDVATSTIVITINGDQSSTPTTKLISYSYIVSYYDKDKEKYIELTNTGNKETREVSLIKKVDLSKYTIKGSARIRVKVTATNVLGNTNSKVFINNYNDKKAPTCRYTNPLHNPTSPFRRTDWINHDEKITVECNDGAGSGCEKDSYTKTFYTEGASGIIKMKDNAGNETECKVVTHIDKTPPTIKVNVFKCNTNKNVGTFEITGGTKTVNGSDLTDSVNGWLNKDKYPDGVCFEFTTTDGSAIKKVTWSWNKTNLKKNASGYTTLDGNDSPKTIEKDTTGIDTITKIDDNHSLTADGHRYAKYEAIDGANNKSTIIFDLPMDRVNPTMTVTAGRCSDRNATNCRTSATTKSQTVTVNNTNRTDNIVDTEWETKGYQIKYTISDRNNVSRLWQYDSNRSMTDRPDAKNGGSSTENPSTEGIVTLTANGKRHGILTATDEAGNYVKVGINVDIANTCTVTYSPNGGTFSKNANDVVQVVKYGDYFGSEANGMRDALGPSGHYYALRDDYVIAYKTEWNTAADGSGSAFDENVRYQATTICPNMNNTNDQTQTLYVRWLKNNKSMSLYQWDYDKRDCDYDTSKTSMGKHYPYRQYHLYSFRCYCDYGQNTSKVTGKPYYKAHSSASRCNNVLLYKDASWDLRCNNEDEVIQTSSGVHNCGTDSKNCFSTQARIYYRANANGKAACNLENGLHNNEYVYRACTNGRVYDNKTSKFFHGARFYWTTGPKRAGFSKWLMSSLKYERLHDENPSAYPYYTIADNDMISSKYQANMLSYNNDKNSGIQGVCENYCKIRWGEYRTTAKDAEVDDDDEEDDTDEDAILVEDDDDGS